MRRKTYLIVFYFTSRDSNFADWLSAKASGREQYMTPLHRQENYTLHEYCTDTFQTCKLAYKLLFYNWKWFKTTENDWKLIIYANIL